VGVCLWSRCLLSLCSYLFHLVREHAALRLADAVLFLPSLTARDAAPELKRAWTKLAPGGQGMQLVKLSE
jgi:hypothetical protein